MGDIFLTEDEGRQLDEILRYGFDSPKAPKWWAVNVAVARSLAMEGLPGDDFGKPHAGQGKGAEIHLEQIVGKKSSHGDNIEYALKLMLGAKHKENIFENEPLFIDLLQKHTRRGLKDIKATWKRGNDFHDFLYQDFFYPHQSSSPVNTTEKKSSLSQAMHDLGIQYEIVGDPIVGPRMTRYIMRLQAINGFVKLKSNLEKLKFAMALPKAPMLVEQAKEKTLALDIPRHQNEWHNISVKVIRDAIQESQNALLPVCLGISPIGENVLFDLAESPHIFVAGTTGSGKSTCVHGIILSLMLLPTRPQLLLIDPKKVEFAPYMKMSKQLFGERVFTEPHDSLEILEILAVEMDRREKELAKIGATNIQEAIRGGQNFSRIVVFIEELADLIAQCPETESTIMQLAAKGRSSGIHLVLATQRPDAETFSGLLRSNIPCRVALQVAKASDSRIIIDESGAEQLLGRGDLFLRLPGHPLIRAHAPYTKASDVLALYR